MFLNNGVGIQGKTKSRLDQEEPGRSYCDFLMFVHQRTRGILDTNMVRYFDRIHKSVRWPCTYDNTDLIAPSSNWLGHHPFTVKITGSSPVGVTDSLI